MIYYIRDNLFSIIFIIFLFAELLLIIGTTCITSFSILDNDYSLHEYLHVIYDNLLYENTYMYPLSKESKDQFTIIGKIFFSILWLIFWALPFILGNILAFPICVFIMTFKKIMFKSPNDKEDKHDIDY